MQTKEARKASRLKYYESHKDKIYSKVKEWRLINKEKKNANQRKHERRYNLKKNYGITLEQYSQMLQDQGGACKICKKVSQKTLHVDHCHKSDKIRGLLCHGCNVSIGLMKESPDCLRQAALYLEANL